MRGERKGRNYKRGEKNANVRDRERNEMRKGHCRHSCKHQQRIYSVARNLSRWKRHKETWNPGPGEKDPKRGDIPGKDGPPLLSQLEKLCFNGVQASWLLSTWEWSGIRKGRLRISETTREWVSFALSCSCFQSLFVLYLPFLEDDNTFYFNNLPYF